MRGIVAVTFAAVAFIFSIVFPICFVFSEIEKNSMESLGYEAKVINVECFAKFNGRWISCDAVTKNQIEIIGQ
jgi:hypothetical protein